jgi:hypothetical protein
MEKEIEYAKLALNKWAMVCLQPDFLTRPGF